MYASPTVSLDRHPLFAATWVGRMLAEDPARVIDVGARDGFDPLFHKLGKLAAVLGFEPDPEAFAALAEDGGIAAPFARVHVEPLALGSGGVQRFHTFSNPNNNSLLPPNLTITSRYAMKMFEYRSSLDVETHRLDDILFDDAKDLQGFGELIKLDTQGSEQLILEHAPRMLSRNTVGVVAEVWFCEVYENQPLFHHLCAYLERMGLRFYGFLSFFLRSGKRLDKRVHAGRERALYADAVFLRDPLDDPESAAGDVAPRRVALLIAFAIVTGYFDFALELAAAFGGEDKDRLAQGIRDCAAADVAAATSDLRDTVTAVEAAPEDAMISMGRFADRWRLGFDYTDVV